MKVGILGSGAAGIALGSGLVRLGYSVMIGTRNTYKEKLQQWMKVNAPHGRLGTFSDAATFGDVVVLCTNWSGTQSAIEMAGIWNFNKKVVIDITNPLDGKGPDANGLLHLAPGTSPSGGERVQAWLPGAHVVKALNSVGCALWSEPRLDEGTPTMFIAGNDDLAKKAVEDILHQLGWKDVADVGHIEMSVHLESLAVIWYAIGFRTGNWRHAFSLLRK